MPTKRVQFTVTGVATNGDGEASVVISTPTEDRGHDRVIPNGGRFKNYLKNPVVMFGHDYQELPVGSCTSLQTTDAGIKATWRWLVGDAFADRVKNAWDQGVLRAASIGFVPLTEKYDAERKGFDYPEWELLEFSIVPIPMNPECVRVLRSLGFEGVTMKGVSPGDISTKKADEGAAWNAPSLQDFTSKSWDELSSNEKSSIAKHYAWADAMPPSSFGDLKFPHHEAKSGAIVWRAVANAAARLGSANIPAADVAKVKAHLARHYRAFDKTPPWDEPGKAIDDVETKDNGDVMYECMRSIHGMLQDCVKAVGTHIGALIDDDHSKSDTVKRLSVVRAHIKQAQYHLAGIDDVACSMVGDGSSEQPGFGPMRPIMSIEALLADLEQRAGARHSSGDRGLIQKAHDAMVELGATCKEQGDADQADTDPDGTGLDDYMDGPTDDLQQAGLRLSLVDVAEDLILELEDGPAPNSFDVDSDVMRHSLKSAIDASLQEVIRLAVKQQVLQYTGRVD